MTHVKTIRRHEAPILSIKLDSVKGVCYFSGSDSRISSIKLLDDKWILGSQVRGQSHDVYSLELCGDYLISGGITTDLCFYERNESGQLGEWVNKVSYSNEKVGQKVDNYVFVNKISGMQIWRMDVEYENVEMLVKYDLPESKHIKQLKVKRLKEERSMGEQDQYFLFMSTENEGVGWIFSEEKGLTKQYTISKHYDLVQFCPETKLMITLSHMTV